MTWLLHYTIFQNTERKRIGSPEVVGLTNEAVA